MQGSLRIENEWRERERYEIMWRKWRIERWIGKEECV